ncbi:hypothetical protein [Paraburkholderia unamae]|uniref:Uncharacterized protein n=2 Tax=Paraburkholderia unamae TaxID=219649 RepID=A0ABX5KAA5_9BURK|nr:hypothetical protein [Paraburkholderia unamae]PVX62725.1 hypothetical protein C7402_13932 [Paraburkholderia unamae]RAR49189.1 hypothetical protein C7401_14731 [Paraburkholderia unamae]CAG9274846.1 conserved hypothetical protein [Paraburkholderia unamae]
MNSTPGPEELNALCTQLFDSFCEHRSVLPLAYLMHAWPLVEGSEHGLRTLRQSLLDLDRWHAAEIDATECLLISQILSRLAIAGQVTADEPERGVAWALETYLPGTRH